jgi:NAD(P)H-dependent flavin oxidoreductase YrpB (nitropropane dioxygenase family)
LWQTGPPEYFFSDHAVNVSPGLTAQSLLDIALSHPIRLIANALGPPPQYMLERSKSAGVAVAALVGSVKHALSQLHAGVDILVAAGTEAGGHCGEIGTMVLVPDVIQAVRAAGSDASILAAGGIVTGRQMAAAVAMGADGAWTGSVWLTTPEAETSPIVKEKMLAATASDTIRSRSRTGKFCRQLRSDWTDAWENAEAPPPPADASSVNHLRHGHEQNPEIGKWRPCRCPEIGKLFRRPGGRNDEQS